VELLICWKNIDRSFHLVLCRDILVAVGMPVQRDPAEREIGRQGNELRPIPYPLIRLHYIGKFSILSIHRNKCAPTPFQFLVLILGG
jgi:hypothetical protein